MNNAQYFYNHFDPTSRCKQILDFDQLYTGQNYILVTDQDVLCGPLVRKTLSNSTIEINYYGIYFRIGLAKYDGITVSDQIRQYHLQSHRNIRDMHYIQIYEYYLSRNLQKQIKTWWYYKKTVNNLCSELNICEDIEKMITKFL
jgi:hypothetical protein